jgi:hypothetical protein
MPNFFQRNRRKEKMDDAKRPSPCSRLAWCTRCLFTKHSAWWLNGWNTSIERSPSKDRTKCSPWL